MCRKLLSEGLPVSHEAMKMIQSWMPKNYFGDDYPREGCTVVLEVGEDKCSMSIYAPDGRILESYHPPRSECGRWVQEWMDGIKPRIKPSDLRPDQSSPGKSVKFYVGNAATIFDPIKRQVAIPNGKAI